MAQSLPHTGTSARLTVQSSHLTGTPPRRTVQSSHLTGTSSRRTVQSFHLTGTPPRRMVQSLYLTRTSVRRTVQSLYLTETSPRRPNSLRNALNINILQSSPSLPVSQSPRLPVSKSPRLLPYPPCACFIGTISIPTPSRRTSPTCGATEIFFSARMGSGMPVSRVILNLFLTKHQSPLP